ncbi:MAG: hypothetical protein ACRD1K_10205 [Acidimicrobiales bacterium]
MRKIRVAAAATTLSLVGAVSSLGTAGAAPAGVGTSEAVTTVLGISLGSGGGLLDLRLLDDIARSTIDSKVNPVSEAFTRLNAVGVKSSVGALAQALPSASFESRTPGGKATDGAPGLKLGDLLPLGLLTGTLDVAKLTSVVDSAGARAGLDGVIGDLSAVGGLLSIKGLTTSLATTAGGGVADTVRGVKVEGIELLDLSSLLSGLGINLVDLLPSQLTGLLGGLNLDVANIGDAAAVQSLINSVQGQITSLLGQVDSLVAPLTGTVINSIVGALPVAGLIPTSTVTDLAAMTNATAQVNALVDSLQGVLAGVLGTVLGTLDGVSLLSVGTSEFGVVTRAADTVGNSLADVTAKLGIVKVAGLSLPGLDLGSTAGQVTSLLDTVNTTLGSVLGAVNPGLTKLVSVSVLDKIRNVSTAGGYTKALAGITGLTASITPPADLAGIVSGITGQRLSGASTGSLLASLGGTVPGLDIAMDTLGTALGTVDALLGGATIKVASLAGSSEFAAASAAAQPAPGARPAVPATGELPRTGGNGVQVAAVGFFFIALGLGFRHWLSMPTLRD